MVLSSLSFSSMEALSFIFVALTCFSITNAAPISFTTKYGDIFDCIEIEKQPALKHPLLKNHVVQMKPTGIPREMKESTEVLPKTGIRCPKGTVPIRRTKQEVGNLMPKQFARTFFTRKTDFTSPVSPSSNSINPTINGNQNDSPGLHTAVLDTNMKIYGIYGGINVWNPDAKGNQSTGAFFSAFTEGGDSVSAGWEVNPAAYGDSKARLYVFCQRAPETETNEVAPPGCIEFVQVSQTVPVPLVLDPVSTYDGDQVVVDVGIKMDDKKNWWLNLVNEAVGYFPAELFVKLGIGASYGRWGGYVDSPENEPSPPMGSGHFAEEGFKKASFIKQVSVSIEGNVTRPPIEQFTQVHSDQDQCYHIAYFKDGGKGWDHFIYFGGPSNCTAKQ